MSVFNRERRRDSERDRLWDRERGIGTQRVRERDCEGDRLWDRISNRDSLRKILRDYESRCEKGGSERYFDWEKEILRERDRETLRMFVFVCERMTCM